MGRFWVMSDGIFKKGVFSLWGVRVWGLDSKERPVRGRKSERDKESDMREERQVV